MTMFPTILLCALFSVCAGHTDQDTGAAPPRVTVQHAVAGDVSTARAPTGLATHEPSGFRAFVDWKSDGVAPWSYTILKAGPDSLVFEKDPSAPGGGTVARVQFGPWHGIPAFRSGNPVHLYYVIPEEQRPIHSLYGAAWMKIDPRWVGHSTGVLKLFEAFVGRSLAIMAVYGSGHGSLRYTMANDSGQDPKYPGCYFQQVGGTCHGWPNVARDEVRRGAWHKYEWLIVANTNGASNGRAVWWLDGKLQGDVRDVRWSPGTGQIPQFDINAIWGGTGGALSAPQSVWIDHVYVSGSREYILGAVP